MSSRLKPRPGVWRDAVRDSELDATTKLVLLTLSTYMNGSGGAFPSQAELAAGASVTDTTVRKATREGERAGFLEIDWSDGRRSHRYRATLPPTANVLRRSEWDADSNPEAPSGFNPEPHVANPEPHVANPEAPSDESVESVESEDLAPAARARDLVWDVLAERFGDVADKTQAHGKRNKAVADLMRNGATPATIHVALRAWPEVFPGATVTDIALATHFVQLVAHRRGRNPTSAREILNLPEVSDENLARARELAEGIGR